MKTVKMNLSEDAIYSDRTLQLSELVAFLNKEGISDWAENTDQEIIEYEIKEDGTRECIYWSVSEPVGNFQGSYTFELDC